MAEFAADLIDALVEELYDKLVMETKGKPLASEREAAVEAANILMRTATLRFRLLCMRVEEAITLAAYLPLGHDRSAIELAVMLHGEGACT